MEYWGYVSQGKGFISDEYDTASDVMGRGKNGFLGWESNSENQGSEELGFHQTAKKSHFRNNPAQESSICGVASERESTPVTSTTNTFSWEEESSSKVSSSVMESKAKASSLVDLNLGRFVDHRDVNDLNASRTAPILSSEEIKTPVRKVRGGLGSVTPYCIVHGCRKDLSSSKEYHRKHKVCEIHSKTDKVLVNGIEQRFCQQCSRFHLLTEFDDGKRSCRKRLAGHNERRRKPQGGFHADKTERILESHLGSAGSRRHGVPQATSFVCEDIVPNNLRHQHKSGTNDWSKRRKLEGGSICYPPLPMPTHGFKKHCPPWNANSVPFESRKESPKNMNRIPHDMDVPASISGATGNKDISFFDSAASTAQGLPGISTAGRAFSLLSPKSHNSSSHSSGMPIAQPLFVSESYSHYYASQRSEKLLGVGLQASTSVLQHKFNSTGMGPTKGHYLSPMLSPDDADDIYYPNENLEGSQLMNGNDQSSHDNGPTISLLALSSQLQRLEHRRRSMQVKQDKGGS